MRIHCIKDQSIPQAEYDETWRQVSKLYKDVAGIDLEVETNEWPLTSLPFETYYGTYRGVSQKFLDTFVHMIEANHGKRFDQVTFFIADEHFAPARDETPVWGWNISAGIRGYEVQQCRFDTASTKKETRIANSVGTLYHEMMHSHDGFCYRMVGGVVERITALGVGSWDEQCVHGQHHTWKYIRHKENQDALRIIAPLLRLACEKRRKQFSEGTTVFQNIAEYARESVIRMTEPYALPMQIP